MQRVNDDLPAELLMAVARAIELLQRVVAEEDRSDEEKLEFSTATLDLISAIDPEAVEKAIEPSVPSAVAAWLEVCLSL
jgi:hypothetical protein